MPLKWGNLKLWGAGVLLAAAFVAGWRVCAWKLNATYQKERAEIAAATAQRLAALQSEVDAANARTSARERALLGQIDTERRTAEELRNEISERPVIKQVVTKTVNGVCAAVPSIDWRVFAQIYNRAATGASSPGASRRSYAALPVPVAHATGEPPGHVGQGPLLGAPGDPQ